MPKKSAQEVAELIQKVDALESDNYAYRQKERERKDEIAKLTGQLPAEGTLVLSAEDAATWKLYQEIGEPKAIKATLVAHDDLTTRVKDMETVAALCNVADAANYDYDVLRTLAGDLEFTVTDGDKGKIVLVKLENNTTQSLADYAEQKWKKFLPSLALADNDQGNQGQGKWLPGQQGGSGKKPDATDLVGEFIKTRAEKQRPSPFDPKE